MKPLLPCPFCGEELQGVVNMIGDYYVRCDYCGACGPWINTANRAKVVWNARVKKVAK